LRQRLSRQHEFGDLNVSPNMTPRVPPFPSAHRVRDRVLSIIIKGLVATVDFDRDSARFMSNPILYMILNGFARLYGFEAESALQEEAGQRGAWNLLKSISKYGITTPQRLKAPVSVVWSLSYKCNLSCMHCYQNASQASSDELTIEEQLDIVDQMARAGVALVVLSGGEPLANPNLERLIERIRMHGMAVSIDSNGVLLDKEAVQNLKRLGVGSVEISVDSVNPEAHDRFRGLAGAFEKTLKAVELCSEAGIFTTVATTSTLLNHSESGELISLARNHGAERVVFFDLIPAGRGRGIQNLELPDNKRLELMHLVKKESSIKRGEVFTELPQFVVYSSIGDGESISDDSTRALSVERFTVSSFFDCGGSNNFYRRFATYLGGCPAGRLYCNIQPNGDVTPCMFMPTYPIAGNLRRQPFDEVWNSSVFETLRERSCLKGKCRECRFVDVCGGCRAKAAAYQGDYLESDPTCPIQAANT
jgi:radical SAM protein with 4Fe4S-binding SPASM domain